MNNEIKIRGARTHNLKNINLDIPREKLVVLTGLSGSGKSSLAFDTLYAEGQRRYVESLSAYARQFLQLMEKPDVDVIEGLSPAISIEQKQLVTIRGRLLVRLLKFMITYACYLPAQVRPTALIMSFPWKLKAFPKWLIPSWRCPKTVS